MGATFHPRPTQIATARKSRQARTPGKLVLCTLAAAVLSLGPGQAAAAAVPLQEPPIPKLVPVAVTARTLTAQTIARDVKTLQQLLSQHPGDGQVRGPDQLVYQLDVTLAPDVHEFAAHESVHVHNNLGRPISTLYFNVWPDAPHYRQAGGYEQVKGVTVDGKPAHFTLHGTLLTVQLNHPLPAGGEGVVAMDLLAKLPHIQDRYGWNGTNIDLGNWFPILAVHDEHGWVTPPYYNDGESFYSLTGAFHLRITAPKTWVLAVTGQETGVQEHPQAGTVTYDYTAVGVRDVAVVADSTYKVLQGRAGNTAIYVYYTPSEKALCTTMLNVAKQALAAYNQWYGPYPYPTLRVCGMVGWFGGMEYPQLVMISFYPGADSASDITADVAHEVAHQWFYGLVGDDQYLTPWIDEAFATLSEQRFDHADISATDPEPAGNHVSYPVSAFGNSDFGGGNAADAYYTTIYNMGARTLYDLMQAMGEPAFDRMLQQYVQRYMYQVATTEDFMQFVSQAAGKDMTAFFQQHLVFAHDSDQAPEQPWVALEEAENQRPWSGEDGP
ncbi:hypothetical protein GCM10010885_17120 [Alicyclobacillus cellulosilyticus]|uniref:Peptidase M1 membrane alanine aminopeptidase domain-containing protein n=1 Tax=Alicyclobacillus cellulosilyticus TaxID=1003997 RepID=A0A917NKY8_9BACL|nr:M1 family metallopeptidase [Alicyclobacillus cellulosilyticus]GGJ08584.1 hypothetical protein GCM10010885_17120 [Alicyclobacillus cellulosilyticus]